MARTLLQKAVEVNPDHEMAWFWLAYVAENPLDTILYLRRVLKINPAQENARAVLKRALLQQGIASAKAGRKTEARALLLDASEMDPANEVAWFWLASVARTPHEAIVCIEKVLEVNPTTERAITWLTRLRLQVASPAPTWQCPLCGATAAEKADRCPKCRAALTIGDLDALLHNEAADAQLLGAAIERLEQQAAPTFHSRYYLGLAYLNLRREAEALACLREASGLQAEDQDLRTLVDRLERRREEVEAARAAQTAPLAAPDAEETAAEVAPAGAAAAQKVILLVDDSPTVRKLVAVTLERQGHRVVVAPGAMEALARLNEVVPDLILLDINMPNMDGYQLCKLIKAGALTKGVPVIMLSGKDGFLDKVRGRMSGAAGYITKPFDPATLLDAVRKYCGPGREG